MKAHTTLALLLALAAGPALAQVTDPMDVTQSVWEWIKAFFPLAAAILGAALFLMWMFGSTRSERLLVWAGGCLGFGMIAFIVQRLTGGSV